MISCAVRVNPMSVPHVVRLISLTHEGSFSDELLLLDTCMTSLFSETFMCRICGREVCKECFLQVRELTEHPTQATPSELTALVMRREKHAHSNPFFLACTKRVEHGFSDFTPVTRFSNDELERAVGEMQEILAKEKRKIQAGPVAAESLETSGLSVSDTADSLETANHHSPIHPVPTHTAENTSGSASTQNSLPPNSDIPPALPGPTTASNERDNFANDFPDPLTSPIYDDYTPANLAPHISNIPIHRAQLIPAHLYDNPSRSTRSHQDGSTPMFSCLWRKGLPLLVKDVLPRFKLQWTPQSFMDRYGDQNCLVVECQDDTLKRVSIREFFGWFGKYGDRTECWKLKVCFSNFVLYPRVLLICLSCCDSRTGLLRLSSKLPSLICTQISARPSPSLTT